jgi:putative transposase
VNEDNLIKNINTILDKSNNDLINSLYNDMSKYQKKIFDSWQNDNQKFIDYSFNDLLFDFDKEFVEAILNMEIDWYLNNHLNNNSKNKRNGYTKDITLTCGNNQIQINRPRLRNEKDFDSIFIKKRTRIMKDIHDNIILLYSKNNSVNDIKDILKAMFNIDISTGKISELLQDISYKVNEWRNKKLDPCYFCLNIDCTYITIRDNKDINSHKIPVYVAVGTNLKGTKEILGIYLGNEDENKNLIDELYNDNIAEATSFWLNVFEDLKERGIEKILYCSSDGLAGIENAIKSSFDGIFYQRCVVHIIRNLKSYTNKSNCTEVINDFKNIYTSQTKDLAIESWNEFKEKYENNKTIIKHASEYVKLIIPLFDVPESIRNYIYTNNISESVNSKIKRGFYGRGALPNAESALNIIFLNLEDLEKKWSNKKVNNWNKIFNEIIEIHGNEINKYL